MRPNEIQKQLKAQPFCRLTPGTTRFIAGRAARSGIRLASPRPVATLTLGFKMPRVPL